MYVMSSEGCKICDLNVSVIKCDKCGIWCCRTCFNSHRQSCSLMVERRYHLCSSHELQMQGYCAVCNILICRSCELDDHKTHHVISVNDSFMNIYKNISRVSEEIQAKEIEELTRLQAMKTEIQMCNSIVTAIKQEEEKWMKLVSESKCFLMSQVERKINKCVTAKEKSEDMLNFLMEIKSNLTLLHSEKFQLVAVSIWSEVIHLILEYERKWQSNETSSQLEDLEMGALPNPSHIIQLFRSRIINTEGTSTDPILSLTSKIYSLKIDENSDVKSTPKSNLEGGGLELEDRMSKDNRMYQQYATEVASLSLEIQLLKDQTKELEISIGMYRQEKNEFLAISDDLVKQVQSKPSSNELTNIPWMTTQVEDKDVFSNNMVMVLNEFVKLQNTLRKTEQELIDKELSVMEWTNEQGEEIEKQRRQYEHQLNRKDSKICLFQTELEVKDKKITELQTLNETLKSQTSKLQQEIFNRQKAEQQMTEKEEMLHHEHEDFKKRLAKSESYCIQIKRQNETLMCTIQHLQSQISNMENKSLLLMEEKEELQSRLSSIAGDKLTKGNPAITDLSDPNRPMKIGEQYGELYDNEWTDAMECTDVVKAIYPTMENLGIEEIAVRHLHRVLICAYRECLELSRKQLQDIQETVTELFCIKKDEIDDSFTGFPGWRDIISRQKKYSANIVKRFLESKVINEKKVCSNWNYINKQEKIITYLLQTVFFEKCVSLCWSMVIQDPIMHLDDELEPGTKYDRNTYKEFVQSGDTVRYAVWPALFLHKDGPLLYKGVVQAYWEPEKTVTVTYV